MRTPYHMGYFTRGSRWRLTRDVFVDQRSNFYREGTEFTVAGACDYGNRIIPVTDTQINTFDSDGMESRKTKSVTGSVMHDRIWRFIEEVNPGQHTLLYGIRGRHRYQGGYYTGATDAWSNAVETSRFYERRNAAINQLIRQSGWVNAYTKNKFDAKSHYIFEYDVRAGIERPCFEIPAAAEAMMRDLMDLVQRDTKRRGMIAEIVRSIDEPTLYLATFTRLNTGNRNLLFDMIKGKNGPKMKVDVHNDNVILFGPDGDAAVTAKLTLPFELSIREFKETV
jgi:hypothetical protein